MDFAFSDEQREFKALCRRFADEVIRPVAARHDAEQSTPWEVIGAAREWGLHGIEHLQRMANDPDGQFSVIYAEELHWGCAGIALAVPTGTPGLEQGKKESKLGIRASHTAEVILEDCRIPIENLLGGMEKLERKLERARSGESTGRASNALATFELTRPVVGASALGIAQAAYEWTLSYLDNGGPADPLGEYLDESSTAGRPPRERQGIQQR